LAKAFLLTSSKAAYRTHVRLQQLFPRLRAPLAGCQIVEK